MTLRPTVILFGSVTLLALAACRRSNPPGPISPSRLAEEPSGTWLLRPEHSAVQRGRELRLELQQFVAGAPQRLGRQDFVCEMAIARMGSEQWSIAPAAPLRIDAIGNALIAVTLELLPDSSFAPSSWSQQHLKTLLQVRDRDADRDRPPPYGGITQKVGQLLEIWPLVDPLGLQPGDELPVRVAFALADSQAGREVIARHLGSSVEQRVRTDAHGSAVIKLATAGSWWIHSSHQHQPTEDGGPGPIRHHASLTFELRETR
jgi:hypothetical protein